MPTWLIIVLSVLGALIFVLAVGGAIAQRRRLEAGAPAFSVELEKVNRDLAAAHAADRGFDPARIEAAAREAFVQLHGTEPEDLVLVQVIDEPGTDDDKVVFRAAAHGAPHTLTLGRRGDAWLLEPAS